MLESSEVSVYDLKDHPDFKYRPGSIVVRVADPRGSSSVGSAGQVLDNHVSGQVVSLLFPPFESLETGSLSIESTSDS